MFGQPGPDVGVVMAAVIVQDHVHGQARWTTSWCCRAVSLRGCSSSTCATTTRPGRTEACSSPCPSHAQSTATMDRSAAMMCSGASFTSTSALLEARTWPLVRRTPSIGHSNVLVARSGCVPMSAQPRGAATSRDPARAYKRVFGLYRIVGELKKLGVAVSKTSVAVVLRRHRLPPVPRRRGPSWRYCRWPEHGQPEKRSSVPR